jgi:hypothetical protein
VAGSRGAISAQRGDGARLWNSFLVRPEALEHFEWGTGLDSYFIEVTLGAVWKTGGSRETIRDIVLSGSQLGISPCSLHSLSVPSSPQNHQPFCAPIGPQMHFGLLNHNR